MAQGPERLIVERLNGEVLVYDTERSEAHALSGAGAVEFAAATDDVSRREVLRKLVLAGVGGAGAGALVKTVVAPTAAHAQSANCGTLTCTASQSCCGNGVGFAFDCCNVVNEVCAGGLGCVPCGVAGLACCFGATCSVPAGECCDAGNCIANGAPCSGQTGGTCCDGSCCGTSACCDQGSCIPNGQPCPASGGNCTNGTCSTSDRHLKRDLHPADPYRVLGLIAAVS
jgi:hypothetical protein